MKDPLFSSIDKRSEHLCAMADEIFDHPEIGFEEHRAVKLLTDYLTQEGFAVQIGLGSLPTAFRAEYTFGDGSGARIGLLCEYDALKKIGHACAHHLQGPSIIAAAAALKENLADSDNCRIIVYGTPAEEGGGGKITMLDEGFMADIDVALMMHGSPTTCTDVRSMACVEANVVFHGKSAHAALKPDAGRSAFDALLLTFQGIEFLREHLLEDSRMHYTVSELPGPANVVPDTAKGTFSLRSYNSAYLNGTIKPRFEDIVKGAALMAGVTCELSYNRALDSKVPVLALNDIVMENARLVNAPTLRPPREKTGSSDFGNVMFRVPGSCIRIAFVPEGTSSHSQTFLDYGKTKDAHDALVYAAKILAGTAWDMVKEPEKLAAVKAEFAATKEKMAQA